MIDIEKEFTCKNCKKEQIVLIGSTSVYKINNNKCIYIPVHCCQCETLHYIADQVTIINEDTNEAKERAFEKVKNIIGNSEKVKDWYCKKTIFITKDKEIILQKNVKIINDEGFRLF